MRIVEDRKNCWAVLEDGKVIGTCWEEKYAREFCAAPEMLDALRALGDPNGHITGCPARIDGACAPECRDVQAAIAKVEWKP